MSTQASIAGPRLSSSGIASGTSTTSPGPVIRLEPQSQSAPEPPQRQPARITWAGDGTVTIDDPDGSGGVFSCVWTVELVKGRFTVITKTVPAGEESRFTYRVTPTGAEAYKDSPRTMGGAPSGDEARLRKGPWSVETTNVPDGWKLKSSRCNESDATTPSTAAGSGATLGVDPDDGVRCTFEFELLAPKAGRWRARNGTSRVVCRGALGGISPSLPAVTDIGRIRVRRDGDLLIARGLSSGGNTTWRLRRDRDRPRRYTGSIRPPVPGAQGRFEVSLTLRNEKRMEGVLTGDLRVRGVRCTFRRSLVLTHMGGN